MPAAKPKLCKAKLRDGSKRKTCDTVYLNVCKNKKNHIQKLKTGFCYNGWHEGSNPRSYSGGPVPTCKQWMVCPCDCHDNIAKLFEMTGSERVLVNSSDYMWKPSFWMPSDDPLPVLSSPSGGTVTPTLQEGVPGVTPARVDVGFAPTPTGRAARGELESWVRIECDAWLVDEPGVYCTPSYLADEIARSQGITPPSVGAITAVFNRWTKIGFAVILKKPTRFRGYTERGLEYGLEGLKAKVKRDESRRRAELKRNIR